MKPATTPPANRRTHQRHPLRVGVALVFDNGYRIEARSLDISSGGLGVVTDTNVPVGVRLTIDMHLPVAPSGAVAFTAQAFVVNTVLAGEDGGFRLGLQFLALDAGCRDALARHLKR